MNYVNRGRPHPTDFNMLLEQLSQITESYSYNETKSDFYLKMTKQRNTHLSSQVLQIKTVQ